MGLKESGLRGSLRNVSVGTDAIPDSVAVRPEDTRSISRDGNDDRHGLEVTLKDDWPSFGARISSMTSGATRAYLHEEDGGESGDLIESKDISNLSAGDAVTFDNVDLNDGQVVFVTADAEGGDWDMGEAEDATDYPYTSDFVDITNAVTFNTSGESGARVFSEVGNVGFD